MEKYQLIILIILAIIAGYSVGVLGRGMFGKNKKSSSGVPLGKDVEPKQKHGYQSTKKKRKRKK